MEGALQLVFRTVVVIFEHEANLIYRADRLSPGKFHSSRHQ